MPKWLQYYMGWGCFSRPPKMFSLFMYDPMSPLAAHFYWNSGEERAVRQSVKRWESRNIWTHTSACPPACCPSPSFLFVCYLLNQFTKVAGNSNSSPSILKRAHPLTWASSAPESWESARKSGPWKAPIGHAAAIKWGHVAPWTCLAAWLGLPAYFLQGPLPCRVYKHSAKVSLLCTVQRLYPQKPCVTSSFGKLCVF